LRRNWSGYAVYKGKSWQRIVITFNDVFWADPGDYAEYFDHYLQGYFGLNGMTLEGSDLDEMFSSRYSDSRKKRMLIISAGKIWIS
jgi:hypothetical protein